MKTHTKDNIIYFPATNFEGHNKNWDYKSSLKLRFRWSKLTFWPGRWCYQTDSTGETIKTGWEWEKK